TVILYCLPSAFSLFLCLYYCHGYRMHAILAKRHMSKNATQVKSAEHLNRAEMQCVHVVGDKKIAGLKRYE
ncbi:hypothetical protein, partial [Pectobacterium versatile]|uniref:hypothetical protein n=2 Tax=Pectobacterium versatile TaxID=2488639 RepID=UPI0010DEB8C2